MIALLDINILIALAWSEHLHHDAAHAWFARNRQRGWATCPTTQAGFLRVSSTPEAVKTIVTVAEAFQILEHNLRDKDHHFWPQNAAVTRMPAEMRTRLMGPRQVGDALLVQLALENGGVLATFDRRIPDLLPAKSPLRAAVEILPI